MGLLPPSLTGSQCTRMDPTVPEWTRVGPPLKPERLLLQAFHVPMYPSGPDCSRLDLDGPPLKPDRALLV